MVKGRKPIDGLQRIKVNFTLNPRNVSKFKKLVGKRNMSYEVDNMIAARVNGTPRGIAS